MSFLRHSSISCIKSSVKPPSVAIRLFASSTQPARKDFDWNSLIAPTTSAQAKSAIKQIESILAELRSQAAKADAKLDPIDWSKYEKSIKQKNVVSDLKRQYEEQLKKYPTGDVKPPYLDSLNKQLDKYIEGAEKAGKVSHEMIPKLEKELSHAENVKDERWKWNLQRWYEEYPGLEEQHRREFMDGKYIIPERERRVMSVDVNELKKSYESGARVNFPEMINEFGDFKLTDKVEELKEIERRIIEGSGVQPRELEANIYVDENPGDAVNPDFKPGEHH